MQSATTTTTNNKVRKQQQEDPMTKRMIKTLTMLTMVVALSLATAAVSADAQSSTKQTANIPFEFVVGNHEMSAGKYDVDGITSGGLVVRIRNASNADSTTRLTSTIVRIKAPDKGKLVFRRYGSTYFLTEVWRAGDPNGRELVKSSREKTAKQELAANTSTERKYEIVEVMFEGQ
jgi:hypothetical protein